LGRKSQAKKIVEHEGGESLRWNTPSPGKRRRIEEVWQTSEGGEERGERVRERRQTSSLLARQSKRNPQVGPGSSGKKSTIEESGASRGNCNHCGKLIGRNFSEREHRKSITKKIKDIGTRNCR